MIRFLLALAAVLILPAAAQAAAWGEATTDNFIVYGQGSEERLVRFATELEQYDQLLRTVTNTQTQRNPVRLRVFLVSRGRDVQRLMGGDNSGVLGVYYRVKDGPFFIASTGSSGGSFAIDGAQILRHEYVHHFMLQNAPAYYPAWYREGFAEYYSTARFDDPRTATIGTPPESRLGTLFYGDWGSYRALLSYDGSDKRIDSGHIYAQGWLMVHAMASDKALAGQVHRYLVAINGGKTPAEAYSAVFGDDADLDSKLARYFRSRRLPAVKVTLRNPVQAGSVRYRRLGHAEAETMEYAVRHSVPRTAAERAELARDFRKVAAEYPDDPAVLRLRAEIEQAGGDPAEAIAAADRLLAKAPDDMRALRAKGLAMIDMAASAKAGPAAFDQARDWPLKANRVEPDDPVTLYHYHQSFVRAGQTPPADASAALIRAFELVPQELDLRLAAALELERVGRFKEARAVAEPLAFTALPREERQKGRDKEQDEEERDYRAKVRQARELVERLPAA